MLNERINNLKYNASYYVVTSQAFARVKLGDVLLPETIPWANGKGLSRDKSA
jgi:hypothetical protein